MNPPRLKPGSLTPLGAVIGLNGQASPQGPVVVPSDFGVSLRRTIARTEALRLAGWLICPAALAPRILDRNELALIHKDHPAYRLFLRTPPERRRHGAARP